MQNILKYNPDRFKEQTEQYIEYIEKLKGTIKQTTGDSAKDVMSQKACTEIFAKKDSEDTIKTDRLTFKLLVVIRFLI